MDAGSFSIPGMINSVSSSLEVVAEVENEL